MLGKILGILGALGMTTPALLGMRVIAGMPKPGSDEMRDPITKGGIDEIQVQIMVGLAVLSLMLVIIHIRAALLPAILGLGALGWYYWEYMLNSDAPPKLVPTPGNGLIVGAVGCVLVVAASFLGKKR